MRIGKVSIPLSRQHDVHLFLDIRPVDITPVLRQARPKHDELLFNFDATRAIYLLSIEEITDGFLLLRLG